MKGSLERRVTTAVSDFFNLPRSQVRLDSSLVDDIGADALDVVEFIYAIEDEFGIHGPTPIDWSLSRMLSSVFAVAHADFDMLPMGSADWHQCGQP